MFVFTGT